jgi:protein AaeX
VRMTSDINLFGVYIPPLILVSLLVIVLLFPLRRLLVRIGFYKLVVRSDVVDLAVFAVLVALFLFLFGGSTLTPLFG